MHPAARASAKGEVSIPHGRKRLRTTTAVGSPGPFIVEMIFKGATASASSPQFRGAAEFQRSARPLVNIRQQPEPPMIPCNHEGKFPRVCRLRTAIQKATGHKQAAVILHDLVGLLACLPWRFITAFLDWCRFHHGRGPRPDGFEPMGAARTSNWDPTALVQGKRGARDLHQGWELPADVDFHGVPEGECSGARLCRFS